jgi:hypothetical protein
VTLFVGTLIHPNVAQAGKGGQDGSSANYLGRGDLPQLDRSAHTIMYQHEKNRPSQTPAEGQYA